MVHLLTYPFQTQKVLDGIDILFNMPLLLSLLD